MGLSSKGLFNAFNHSLICFRVDSRATLLRTLPLGSDQVCARSKEQGHSVPYTKSPYSAVTKAGRSWPLPLPLSLSKPRQQRHGPFTESQQNAFHASAQVGVHF